MLAVISFIPSILDTPVLNTLYDSLKFSPNSKWRDAYILNLNIIMKQTCPSLHALGQNNHCIKLSEFIPDIKKKKKKRKYNTWQESCTFFIHREINVSFLLEVNVSRTYTLQIQF